MSGSRKRISKQAREVARNNAMESRTGTNLGRSMIRGTMGLASDPMVLFIVFCFIPTRIVSQKPTAPVVSLEGTTIYAVLNRQKVISCTVQDSTGTVVTVVWQKNRVNLANSVISGYTWNIKPVNSHADLTIQNVQQSDEATFTCVAENGLHGKSELDAEIIVIALNVTMPDATTYAATGQTKTIKCQVSGSFLSFVNWSWNGVSLTVGSKYSWTYNNFSGRADLLVYNVTKVDAGKYTCSAQSTLGRSTQGTTGLIVEDVLSVTVVSVADGILGQNKTIPCAITGTPINTVQWLLNDNQLSNNYQYTWKTGAMADLHISSLTLDNTGTYTCWALNHVGTNKDSVSLSVISRPMATVGKSTDLSANEGENVLINCVITNTITIDTFQWYIWDRLLSEHDSHYSWSSVNGVSIPFDGSLRIYNVTSHDTGTYKCKATNVAGAGEGAIRLFVSATESPGGAGPNAGQFEGFRTATIVLGVLFGVSFFFIACICFCAIRHKDK